MRNMTRIEWHFTYTTLVVLNTTVHFLSPADSCLHSDCIGNTKKWYNFCIILLATGRKKMTMKTARYAEITDIIVVRKIVFG